MEFRTRHQAMLYAFVLTLAGIHTKIITSWEHLTVVFGAYAAMFAWDKIEKLTKKI